MTDPEGVIMLTGVMAAGKSTVAEALAARFARGVHLRGDVFRRMIVTGRAEQTAEGAADALAQLRLRYRLAAAAADTYAAEGFTVIWQDVMIGSLLSEAVELVSTRPLRLVVLAPSPAAVSAREAARVKRGYGSWTVEALDRLLREETPRLGWWVDTSTWTVDETVEHLLAGLDQAVVRDR